MARKQNGADITAPNQVDDAVRVGPVADQVAQAEYGLETPLVDVRKDGSQRQAVAVNVGDDRRRSHARDPFPRHPKQDYTGFEGLLTAWMLAERT